MLIKHAESHRSEPGRRAARDVLGRARHGRHRGHRRPLRHGRRLSAPPRRSGAISAARALTAIKVVHTAVWAFFVACIAVIPVFAWRANYRYAALFIGIVVLEVAALALNGRRCPLTDLATRYTDDRRDNFDIYLPEWLARHNKLIFGTLYVAGIAFTLLRWTGER